MGINELAAEMYRRAGQAEKNQHGRHIVSIQRAETSWRAIDRRTDRFVLLLDVQPEGTVAVTDCGEIGQRYTCFWTPAPQHMAEALISDWLRFHSGESRQLELDL